jgi:histidinol-phosphate aminotransferase
MKTVKTRNIMNKTFDLTSLIRPNVLSMKPYSSARDEFTDFDQEMIFLDANENPNDNGVNRYPDPQQRTLKTRIASLKGIDTAQILLGNGSDEVLDLIFRAFCIPGIDNVISLPPTYGMYSVLSMTNDIENREVLLSLDFQPDLEKILQQVNENTKLLFLCSPNNPTGNLISPKKIEQLLFKFSGIVVIDEAYIDFAAAPSWIERLSAYPNLIVTQTLSKAYGMAGIRLGLCFASSEIIAVLQKIKPPYNVNKLTQTKALERVRNIKDVHREVSVITGNREHLVKVLLQVDFVSKVYLSEANFVLVKVDDANLRYNQLITAGVVVRNRSSQALCENTLRFTIGTKEECEQLVKTLKELN